MSISIQFDKSQLDTKPGDSMKKIGSAISTLSGRTAKAGSVEGMMSGAIRENEANTAAANKQAARDDEVAHIIRKETVRGTIKQGMKLAGNMANNESGVKTFRAKEAAKRSTMRTAAASKVNVETAKQATKSTPIAKAAPASKPPVAAASKPRAPRKPAGPLIHTDVKGNVTGYTHRSPATLGTSAKTAVSKPLKNMSAPTPTSGAKPVKPKTIK